MHMIIKKEKCLSLLQSPYIAPYSIKSIDNEALHEEELLFQPMNSQSIPLKKIATISYSLP